MERIEKWRKDARNASSDLFDISYGTLEETINTAKYILEMYSEDENDFSADLNCDEYKDEKRNREVRANARKEITRLKNFIKKYDKI